MNLVPRRPRALVPFLVAASIVAAAVLFARSLTSSRPEPVETPTETVTVAKTAAMPPIPPFRVLPRVAALEEKGTYPCTECHDGSLKPDPTERDMPEDHGDIKLVHGGGRFWCLTCHDADHRDQLRGLKGQAISFDEQYLLCGQCHFRRQRDFFYGAHGKRVGNWQGERVLTGCTQCHDPHDPSIKPRKPYRPDKLRPGLLAETRAAPKLIQEDAHHDER